MAEGRESERFFFTFYKMVIRKLCHIHTQRRPTEWINLIKIHNPINFPFERLLKNSSTPLPADNINTQIREIYSLFVNSTLCCCCCQEISSATQFYELKYHTHSTSLLNIAPHAEWSENLLLQQPHHAQTFLLFSIKFYILSSAICIQIRAAARRKREEKEKKSKQ